MIKDIVIHLIDNPRASIVILAAVALLQLGPGYMAYRVEQAVIALTNKIECGAKIHISSAKMAHQLEVQN